LPGAIIEKSRAQNPAKTQTGEIQRTKCRDVLVADDNESALHTVSIILIVRLFAVTV